MAIYYTGVSNGNQIDFRTGDATVVAADIKQYFIEQSVTGNTTGTVPSNKAVFDFGTGLSGYLNTNAGGLYQLSALSTGVDIAAINLTGRVSGVSFVDSVTISGGAGLDLSVSSDAIVLSHTDTSSVADLSVNAAAGSAITGISFTYDTFGHVLTATGTTAVIVRNQIQSGVTTTAPSEAAVHTLSGYLATNAGGVYQISSQSPGTNVAQINLTGTVSGASFNDFVRISGVTGIDISVSNDIISVSHNDTSSVANASISANAGSAITGVSFTFDSFGHVLTATGTSAVIVRDQIASGVTTTAPSEGSVYTLSGSLQSQITSANALNLQSVTNNGSTTTNGISIGGDLVASGNVTLGSDSSDTLTINAGPIVLTNVVTGGDALIFGPNDSSKVSVYKSDTNTLRLEGGLVITGNLTVQGTTTTIESNTVSVGDSIIMLNGDFTGSAPSENAGIEIERGTQTNTSLIWNEGTDRWTFTNDGSTYYNIPVTSELTLDATTTNGASTSNDIVVGGVTVSGAAQAKSDHFVVYCNTSNSSTTEMFLNGTNGRIALANNSAVAFKGNITAFDSANTKAASWSYNCLVANKAGNTALVGAAHVIKLGDDSNGVWEVFVDGDNTNDSLKLQVKGENTANIKWTASVISSVVS
jgi:hypothetical protein